MIKGHPQTDGGALFVSGRCGSFGPVGTVWWGVCDTPLHGYTPFMYPANLAGIPDALSALLSDSIFAAVFGDAKSDGPVRDVKRESSERLEQCPLL